MTHHTGSIPDTADRPFDWLANTPCKADPEAMFPGTNSHDIEIAKSICRGCSATDRCLQWALDTGEELGVWGGLSEGERRALKRRTGRPISIDDYTGIPATRAPLAGRTFAQAWEDGTDPDGDHILWAGPKTIPHPNGAVTPNRLSFYLDRSHWPQGEVRRTCGISRCVKPSHLNDRVERAEEADLLVQPPKREPARCGTRPGYQQHRKNGEDACDACRQANTDADNRLRRTGTTKKVAA